MINERQEILEIVEKIRGALDEWNAQDLDAEPYADCDVSTIRADFARASLCGSKAIIALNGRVTRRNLVAALEFIGRAANIERTYSYHCAGRESKIWHDAFMSIGAFMARETD